MFKLSNWLWKMIEVFKKEMWKIHIFRYFMNFVGFQLWREQKYFPCSLIDLDVHYSPLFLYGICAISAPSIYMTFRFFIVVGIDYYWIFTVPIWLHMIYYLYYIYSLIFTTWIYICKKFLQWENFCSWNIRLIKNISMIRYFWKMSSC